MQPRSVQFPSACVLVSDGALLRIRFVGDVHQWEYGFHNPTHLGQPLADLVCPCLLLRV